MSALQQDLSLYEGQLEALRKASNGKAEAGKASEQGLHQTIASLKQELHVLAWVCLFIWLRLTHPTPGIEPGLGVRKKKYHKKIVYLKKLYILKRNASPSQRCLRTENRTEQLKKLFI